MAKRGGGEGAFDRGYINVSAEEPEKRNRAAGIRRAVRIV